MTAVPRHGVGQKVGVAVVCIGFCLCLACGIAPNWLKAETTVKEFLTVENTTLKNKSLSDYLDVSVGLWRFCVDLDNDDDNLCFSLYDEYDFEDWINISRVAAFANVLMGMVCGLAACCSCLCCCRGRTVGFGVFSCLSGIFGFVAIIVIYLSVENDCLLSISIERESYDWSYIFYTCGSFILIVGSVLLCLCAPTHNKDDVISENSPVMGNPVNPSNPSYPSNPS